MIKIIILKNDQTITTITLQPLVSNLKTHSYLGTFAVHQQLQSMHVS